MELHHGRMGRVIMPDHASKQPKANHPNGTHATVPSSPGRRTLTEQAYLAEGNPDSGLGGAIQRRQGAPAAPAPVPDEAALLAPVVPHPDRIQWVFGRRETA